MSPRVTQVLLRPTTSVLNTRSRASDWRAAGGEACATQNKAFHVYMLARASWASWSTRPTHIGALTF